MPVRAVKATYCYHLWRMLRSQKIYVCILLLLSAALFAALWLPNQAASEDIAMVFSFEADEAVPFPYLLDMLQPQGTLKHTLANIFAYEYYFYGFPYFAYSALVLLPLAVLGQLGNTPLVMALLRNLVSVTPMLGAIGLLVYMHTRFRDYRAVVLFLFLALLPGVMYNNFWWHPDSLAIFLAMLTLFFLVRDDLRLGRNFYLAAVACGISAQIKLIGVYFFLGVLVYLWHGYRSGQPPRRLLLAAAGFLATMLLAFFASNPILVYAGARSTYLNTLLTQAGFMAGGFELLYARGVPEVTRMLNDNFGGWLLLAGSVLAAVWAALSSAQPLLYRLILAWALPLGVYVFGFSIVKFQYWLPAALPLLSCLVVALPPSRSEALRWWRSQRGWALAAALIVVASLYTATQFVPHTARIYKTQLARQQGNPSLAFFAAASDALAPLPPQAYHVYADVNLYIPESTGWVRSARFETLTYGYIRAYSFQMLFLSQTRIWDYMNEDALGVDPERLEISRLFYADADAGQIEGYHLVYRDDFGLVFVNEALYEEYFAP